ncbi:hypothetical protein LMH87_003875 [Akanthomyces muscarius]|uniref:Uncharacterized protein n=1 Tax=Akanthomyces muscarius TaxID=2231603 RepID=A0A9W8Q291_AKAMU|nr:hypothetical protein LMH87_003875 [Akanthomyces muscarius]KAJ4145013.1 hypothetical protein LMH87_003875 [Akanthomyces muscarius]
MRWWGAQMCLNRGQSVNEIHTVWLLGRLSPASVANWLHKQGQREVAEAKQSLPPVSALGLPLAGCDRVIVTRLRVPLRSIPAGEGTSAARD